MWGQIFATSTRLRHKHSSAIFGLCSGFNRSDINLLSCKAWTVCFKSLWFWSNSLQVSRRKTLSGLELITFLSESIPMILSVLFLKLRITEQRVWGGSVLHSVNRFVSISVGPTERSYLLLICVPGPARLKSSDLPIILYSTERLPSALTCLRVEFCSEGKNLAFERRWHWFMPGECHICERFFSFHLPAQVKVQSCRLFRAHFTL